MVMRTRFLWVALLVPGSVMGQAPPPPAPPGPPQFMTMKGFPLSCFEKPAFVEDGLEFFVCNGGGGLAGVRKKADAAHTVFVRSPEIALNLNMQTAKAACGKGRFSVRGAGGMFWFECDGKEAEAHERFRAASNGEWKRYRAYMDK